MSKTKFIPVEEYFREKVEEKYLCKGCQSLLLNARQLSCGCARFCDKCEVSSTCQFCGTKDVKTHFDKATVKDLKRIKLKCCFNGCETEIVYGSYMNHVTNCDFRIIECKDCNQAVAMKELKNHRTKLCENLERKCPYCLKMTLLSKHMQCDEFTPPDCENFIGDCPNCKDKNVKLKKHYQMCTNTPCLLKIYGCKGVARKGECSSIADHRGIIEKVFESFNSEIQKVTVNYDIDKEDKTMMTAIEDLGRQISHIQEQIQNNLKLYYTPKKGKFLWRINNVDTVLNDRGSIMSDPMYSEEYGYKLCIKIYPQGDGKGKHKYFSLFYVVMKGDYDELLSWPFDKKVRLTIYNQSDKSKNKSELYRPDFNSKSSMRPKYDMNTATGNPCFLRLDVLEEKGFIQDNVMFIEISIDNGKTFL